MRQMISSVAIGATLSLGLALGQAAAASAAIGHLSGEATQCTSVPYGWAGTTTIAPGQSFSTGLVVPSEPGVQLAVVAFDVSTVDPAPGACEHCALASLCRIDEPSLGDAEGAWSERDDGSPAEGA